MTTKRLPKNMAHWKHHLDRYRRFIRRHGGMTGADADRMERTVRPTVQRWSGDMNIGDILVAPGCGHIYRLQCFCAAGLLRKVIRGKEPGQVYYYMVKP